MPKIVIRHRVKAFIAGSVDILENDINDFANAMRTKPYGVNFRIINLSLAKTNLGGVVALVAYETYEEMQKYSNNYERSDAV